MDFLFPLFGRFHPLFVHLPIGILFFAVLLVFLSGKEKTSFLPVIPVAFLCGAFFALLSGISGFLQYRHEGYTWETVQIHLILGWSTVAVAIWLYISFRKTTEVTRILKAKSGGLFLLLMLTGHLGGNITRGDDYLFEVLPPGLQSFLGIEIEASKPLELPTENWEEIEFYTGAIQQILNHNCISCHNPKNLKGKLDLTSSEGLLKGGESGEILFNGNPEKSGLFARLVLPKEDEEHMPPKEKRQPRKEEIELIKAWIESGASLEKSLGSAQVPISLISAFFVKEENLFYPPTDTKFIAIDSLSALRKKGFFAENISLDSPLLRISCINFPDFQDEDWNKLISFSDNIAYLDLSGTQVTDAIIDSVSSLKNLTVLKINDADIEGGSLVKLKNTQNLKLLYLNSTAVTLDHLKLLDGHLNLTKIFVYKTSVSTNPDDKLSFELETGDFLLPKLATDTIVY